MSAYLRQAHYRQRQAKGLATLQPVVHLLDTEEMLQRFGFLEPGFHTREEISEALARLTERLNACPTEPLVACETTW